MSGATTTVNGQRVLVQVNYRDLAEHRVTKAIRFARLRALGAQKQRLATAR